MRQPRTWVARVANWRMPGSWTGPQGRTPGQVTLCCELSEAGKTHGGRSVDVVIPADHLEDLARIVASAIRDRDVARAAAYRRSLAGLPSGKGN